MTAAGAWSEYALTPEELSGLVGTLDPGLSCRPLPAVLDTDFVRTGLHYQLSKGAPPASVSIARDGKARLFMEYDTLIEAIARLPRFAGQFDIPVSELRRMLDEDWLPHVQVVTLPPELRQQPERISESRP